MPASSRKVDLAEAFRVAKEYLAQDIQQMRFGEKQRYICASLQMAFRNRQISNAQMTKALKLIEKRLEGKWTLEGWLREKGVVPYDFNHYADGYRRVQDTRHRWLDSLIEEFSPRA